MLRITLQEAPDSVRLELEGRLSGAWVAELEESWRAAMLAHPNLRATVDLSRVECVDAAGKYLLALMHERGVAFITSGCAMSALIREISGTWPANERLKKRKGCFS